MTFASGLDLLGLGDVKLLVKLMRLVAAGRTSCVSEEPSEGEAVSSEDGTSRDARGNLKVLSRAVEALAASDPSGNNMLLQLCVKDLMTSATGMSFPFLTAFFGTYYPKGLDTNGERSEERRKNGPRT